jgi:Fe-S oxidoreductase
VAARAPAVANGLMSSRLVSRVARWAAGVDNRVALPLFAEQTFQQWWSSQQAWREPEQSGSSPDSLRPVALWVDSFTDHFAPHVAIAAATVLRHAGYRVEVPPPEACCGLTWITTGQLDAARKILGRTVTILSRYADADIPIVGLEPSCTAVLRADATELLRSDTAAARVSAATRTLAELLTDTASWLPPDLHGTDVIAQPHCHHHAVMGWSADASALHRAGVVVNRLGGCCGLAGNWGVERGHYDVSVAIAEQQLLPAVRESGRETVVLADGFSCRTQLEQLTGRHGTHLAELLAGALPARSA